MSPAANCGGRSGGRGGTLEDLCSGPDSGSVSQCLLSIVPPKGADVCQGLFSEVDEPTFVPWEQVGGASCGAAASITHSVDSV